MKGCASSNLMQLKRLRLHACTSGLNAALTTFALAKDSGLV